MAKKSNKTEHVLRLITKNGAPVREDDLFAIDDDIYENGTSAVRRAALAEADLNPEKAGSEQDDRKGPETKKTEGAAAETMSDQEQPSASEPVRQEPTAADSAEAEVRHESPVLRSFKEQENLMPAAVPDQSGDLVNIAEILARERIAMVMERMKVCTCGICYNDVLALTLNSLPTKYVATGSGKQYLQRNEYKEKYETDILAALTKACVRVKASPRH